MKTERLVLEELKPKLYEFKNRFATEEACKEGLFNWRWPNGFRCPRCHGDSYYRHQNRGLYECVDCRYQVSLTAGTIFHRSKRPLTQWFLMVFLHGLTDGKIPITYLQRLWGVGNYKSLWGMKQKVVDATKGSHEYYDLVGLDRMSDTFGGMTTK